ncbi:MAG TPA: MotA/TolQ/ExbB proton channel family protein [Gammaproteobacteria bacterium]|nr:MotA/TolQ/ExbB proton channel family protein [Gammaproteobacteria bacterium]
MSLLGILEKGLFALGQVLRFPVMALLWVCVAAVLFMAGAAVVDALGRRRERRGFDIDRWLRDGGALGADERRRGALPPALRRLLVEIQTTRSAGDLGEGGLEHLVLAHEERARATLSGSRMLVKVGPSLGLLGTLIPMGTALAALSTGNLEAMAGQMVVAFTTTIIGLACGTAAFVITSVRQHWVNETVREQRFLAERVAAELEGAEGAASPAGAHDDARDLHARGSAPSLLARKV